MSETKKNLGGRPRVDAVPVTVRVPPADLAHLDAYIAAQPDPKPSRPEAIRALLREGLAGKGLMPAETAAELEHQIEVLKVDLALIHVEEEVSPEAALHTMDRAITENELVELKGKRKRLRKPSPRHRDDAQGAN